MVVDGVWVATAVDTGLDAVVVVVVVCGERVVVVVVDGG